MTLAARGSTRSMTTYPGHRIWEKVYQAATSAQNEAYIKIPLRERAPMIRFKRTMGMGRSCQNCETAKEKGRFEGQTFTIEHAGMTARVGRLSGWRCEACGEVEFDPDCARRYAAAGDELVLRGRERQSREIRRPSTRNSA